MCHFLTFTSTFYIYRTILMLIVQLICTYPILGSDINYYYNIIKKKKVSGQSINEVAFTRVMNKNVKLQVRILTCIWCAGVKNEYSVQQLDPVTTEILVGHKAGLLAVWGVYRRIDNNIKKIFSIVKKLSISLNVNTQVKCPWTVNSLRLN